MRRLLWMAVGMGLAVCGFLFWQVLPIVMAPIAEAKAEAYREAMRTLCKGVERYQRAHNGEIPSMQDLLIADPGILKELGLPSEHVAETYELINVPGCTIVDGKTTDTYVLYARSPPLVMNWGCLYVGGKEVRLDN